MKLYLYSSQDLILAVPNPSRTSAGRVYRVKLDKDENITIYCPYSAGVVFLNLDILLHKQHSQINFYKLNENAILCEIKPFVAGDDFVLYRTQNASVKTVIQNGNTHIYFNDRYYGSIGQIFGDAKFEIKETGGQQYGILKSNNPQKYLILFNNNRVVYCDKYIDIENKKNFLQIYAHNPNIFNVGKLLKYDFGTDVFDSKTVDDRMGERKQINNEFVIIYFLDAIKCGRIKYAYNQLSYELKSDVNIYALKKYFKPFDKYIYLHEQDSYITLKNNKVTGIYHFVVKDNLIDNIY